MKKTLLLLLSFMLLIHGLAAAAPAQADALTIVYTNDMHSYVEPFMIEADGVSREAGGFARRKTLIDALKAEKDAVFVLDSGDFAMGTLIQTVYRERASELRLLGAIGVDATTIGNHELDFRDSGFAQMLQTAIAAKGPLPLLVMANLTAPDATVQSALDAYGVAPYKVIDRGGIRMAVIGLMGVESLATAPMTKFAWEPVADAAKRVVKQIKENETVDIIVALSHTGLSKDTAKSEDEQLAKAVPELDVIVSGHTHTYLPEPITVGHTHIVSQGEYGEYFSQITLERRADGRWDISGHSHRVIEDSVAEDERVAEMVAGFIQDASDLYLSLYGYTADQVLAKNPHAFVPLSDFGRVLREETLGNLISDAFRYAVQKAEGPDYEEITMAMTAHGLVRGSLAKGDVTVVDAFNISSLGFGADGSPGYPLISVYITGEELRTAAEVDVSVSSLMSAAQLYPSGVCWSYNPHRMILNRVTDVWIEKSDGAREEIEDKKLYRIVTGLYCAQMLSAVESKSFKLLSITPKNKDGSVMTDFEANIILDAQGRELKEWAAIADYLQSMGTVSDAYATTQNRKVSQPDASVGAFFSHPNRVGMLAFGIIALLLILIALVITLIVLCKKRKKQRRAKAAASL
ncbi:MAG: bifunctional metallophosphatase/5'-nucleotidase [Clostridia bacterium]|nr:bifunctional metallophosphatase/5'-nucleotidase [Clostridia bacterium]